MEESEPIDDHMRLVKLYEISEKEFIEYVKPFPSGTNAEHYGNIRRPANIPSSGGSGSGKDGRDGRNGKNGKDGKDGHQYWYESAGETMSEALGNVGDYFVTITNELLQKIEEIGTGVISWGLIQEDDNNWNETTIRYSNEPSHYSGLSAGPFASVTVENLNQYYDFDVTELVNGTNNNTITMVLANNIIEQNNGILFADETTLNPPKLILELVQTGMTIPDTTIPESSDNEIACGNGTVYNSTSNQCVIDPDVESQYKQTITDQEQEIASLTTSLEQCIDDSVPSESSLNQTSTLYCGLPESSYNVIYGTDSPDILTGTNGNDLIFGYAGSDTINGFHGSDCIIGGSQVDIISASPSSTCIDPESQDVIAHCKVVTE